jgi:hypothetical protein
MTRLRTFVAILPALVAAQAVSDTFADDIAIVGAGILPMDAERVLDDHTLLLSDGQITTIAPSASVRVPPGYRVIDGSSMYAMPGLADLHTHLRDNSELARYLYWGVTTTMHLGGSGMPGKDVLALRERIRAGEISGPSLYVTERIVDGAPRIATNAWSVTTAEEAREIVRGLTGDGYDFVKIYNNVSLEVFDALVAEAGVQGLRVFGHIPRNIDPRHTLAGGLAAIAHSEELFFTWFRGPRSTVDLPAEYEPDLSSLPELTRTLLEHRVAVMPDLSFAWTNLLYWDDPANITGDPEYTHLSAAARDHWERATPDKRTDLENFVVREQWKYALMQRLTRHFQHSGVLQVIGTDASIPAMFPGKSAHRELTELVKAGLSNYEALSIGTRNAGDFVARYVDPDARIGQLREGYRADLLLVEANPLDDVRNARRIAVVIANGRAYTRDDLASPDRATPAVPLERTAGAGTQPRSW